MPLNYLINVSLKFQPDSTILYFGLFPLITTNYFQDVSTRTPLQFYQRICVRDALKKKETAYLVTCVQIQGTPTPLPLIVTT